MPERGEAFADLIYGGGEPASCQTTVGKKGSKSGLKRRKKANRKVEDYYALLDVGESATAADIKRGYMGKVRQYPPEQYPEEFERIRKAYDTLRDVTLRKEYDIVRQYGETIEDLIKEAVGKGSITSQSVKLLERAVKIDPTNAKVRLSLAFAYIYRGDKAAFEMQFSELLLQAAPDKQLSIMESKIAQLLKAHQTQAAFEELQKLKKTQMDAILKIWPAYIKVYEAIGKEEKFLAEVEDTIKAIGVPEPANAEMYASWIYIVNAFEDYGVQTDRVLSATKRWLKNFTNKSDLEFISKVFIKEYENCREKSDYYCAKTFVDLALRADRKNPAWRQYAEEVQTAIMLMREVERIFADGGLFPGVLFEVVRRINEEFDVLEEELRELEFWLASNIQEDLHEMDEDYVAGIILLKKRHPMIYRRYQQQWDAIFQEKTAGLNMMQRRRLRI